jgi:hypothetical protein
LIFVLKWVDTNLHPDVLKVEIAPDGMRVVMKTKRNDCEDPTVILNKYSFAKNIDHYLVKALGDELKFYNRNKTVEDEWISEVIVELREEVVREFVAVSGGMNDNKIKYEQDPWGRQYISFCLSVMNHDKVAPKAGIFDNSERAQATRPSSLAAAAAAAAAAASSNMVDIADQVNDLETKLHDLETNVANTIEAKLDTTLQPKLDALQATLVQLLNANMNQQVNHSVTTAVGGIAQHMADHITSEVTQRVLTQHQQDAAALDAAAQQQFFMTPQASPDAAPSSGSHF